MAGESNQKVVFLFTDTQIKLESFVEDISNLLNTYEVCCQCSNPHVRPLCLDGCVITTAMCASILAHPLPPHQLLMLTSSRTLHLSAGSQSAAASRPCLCL